MSKLIVTIPINIWIDDAEINTDKKITNKLNEIKRELARLQFGMYGGSYSYKKKKCRQSDIKIY